MKRLIPIVLLLLVGCEPEEDPGPVGPPIYEEDDDNGNHRRSLAEEVDEDWTTELEIHGSLEECGGERQGSEWDYSGDLDYYDVEIPADGWIEIAWTWDHDADVDGVVRTNGRSRSILNTESNEGPEEYIRDDPHEERDDLNIGVFCKDGEPGDYVIRVELELD